MDGWGRWWNKDGGEMCVLRRRKYEKLKFVLVNGYWNIEVFEGCKEWNDKFRALLSCRLEF